MKEDELIWITGASSGIGEALARELGSSREFRSQGLKLALSARSKDKLETLAKEINDSAGGEEIAKAFPLDVLDKKKNEECTNEIESFFGRPVSIYIPCAGTYTTSDSKNHYTSEEHTKLMELNFFSMLYGIEAVLPSMKEKGYGQIVGVSSLVGYFGMPRAVGYSASKAAIINALQSLRFELRSSGIQVKVVNPGFVKTPLTDKNDFEMPFLITAEDAAKHMVGALKSSRFETHFPWSLSFFFKLLRILPQPLFEFLVRKIVYRNDRKGDE